MVSSQTKIKARKLTFADGNRIRSFPEEFNVVPLCPKLSSLSLQRNGLEDIRIGNLFPMLKQLHIDYNNVSCVQKAEEGEALEMLSARHQRSLNVPGCVQIAPCEVNRLAHQDVRNIFLSSNNISEIYMKTTFMNLEHFELASSGLRSLPANFGALAPNLRSLNLNCNSLKDLTPFIGLKKLKSLALAGNRLARLRKAMGVLQKLPDLERLDFRDNPFTVGFYEPIAQNKILRREDCELLNEHNPFEFAAADVEADVRYRAMLDEATQLRRRVYDMLVATHCRNLQHLDGLPFSKKKVMAKDSSWDRLIDLGVVKASRANLRAH